MPRADTLDRIVPRYGARDLPKPHISRSAGAWKCAATLGGRELARFGYTPREAYLRWLMVAEDVWR
jgi:hypothetical protein